MPEMISLVRAKLLAEGNMSNRYILSPINGVTPDICEPCAAKLGTLPYATCYALKLAGQRYQAELALNTKHKVDDRYVDTEVLITQDAACRPTF